MLVGSGTPTLSQHQQVNSMNSSVSLYPVGMEQSQSFFSSPPASGSFVSPTLTNRYINNYSGHSHAQDIVVKMEYNDDFIECAHSSQTRGQSDSSSSNGSSSTPDGTLASTSYYPEQLASAVVAAVAAASNGNMLDLNSTAHHHSSVDTLYSMASGTSESSDVSLFHYGHLTSEQLMHEQSSQQMVRSRTNSTIGNTSGTYANKRQRCQTVGTHYNASQQQASNQDLAHHLEHHHLNQQNASFSTQANYYADPLWPNQSSTASNTSPTRNKSSENSGNLIKKESPSSPQQYGSLEQHVHEMNSYHSNGNGRCKNARSQIASATDYN